METRRTLILHRPPGCPPAGQPPPYPHPPRCPAALPQDAPLPLLPSRRTPRRPAALPQGTVTSLQHPQGSDSVLRAHAQSWPWSHSAGRDPHSTTTDMGHGQVTRPLRVTRGRDRPRRVAGRPNRGDTGKGLERAVPSHVGPTHRGPFSAAAIIASRSLHGSLHCPGNRLEDRTLPAEKPKWEPVLGLNHNQLTRGFPTCDS